MQWSPFFHRTHRSINPVGGADSGHGSLSPFPLPHQGKAYHNPLSAVDSKNREERETYINWYNAMPHQNFDYSELSPNVTLKLKVIVVMIKDLDLNEDFQLIGELLAEVFLNYLPAAKQKSWVESELQGLMTFTEAMAYYLTEILGEEELISIERL
ncbi:MULTISPECIES: hypothetical protein [unclassified Synechocystis]|nr:MULTISPECIES: hypothetical protein [unclassified Synechocystis]